MAILVERATSDLLIGPDWGLNLEICDAVNHNPSLSRDIVKALKKRLSNKNAKVQLLALTVLEMVMKNCGDSIHQMVAEKDVVHDMVKIVKKKADLAVRDKILALVESWQKAFGGPMAKYPQYSAAYDELRRSGVQFPIQSITETVPMFTPSAATQTHSVAAAYTAPTLNTTRSLPQLAYGLPAFEPARLDEVLAASENSVCSAKDLDGAQRTLEVLNEMLSALDPGEKQAVFNDVIGQLVEQCVTNQKIIQQMVNSTADESMLFRGLSLNDDIQQVLVKHSSIVAKALSQAEPTPGSPPRGLTVYDNEDDEAEDEVSHLAHRSSSRSSRSSQENGLLPKTTHAPPVEVPITPLNASSLGQINGAYGEGASLAASSEPVIPSRTHQVLDEEQSMVNPFANTAPIRAFPSNGSLSSATGSSSVSLDSSKRAARQPSHYEKTFREPDSSAYKAPSQGLENIWASELRAQKQDDTSQALESPFDDDDMVNPTASWKPVVKPKTVSSLPPPPILSSERERFFEEKRQTYPSPKLGSVAPSSMERRMQSLNLVDTKPDQGTQANGGLAQTSTKQVSTSEKQAERLFEDLVDFRSMRTNYKTSGVASIFSRPKGSGAGGT